MRRLAAALGIGLAAEVLMLAVYFGIVGGAPSRWWWTLLALTQEPGRHLVEWWVGATRSGFEEESGYIYFVPLIQWLLYAAVVYAILWRRNRVPKSN
jgi:hypothetical protein